MAAAGVMSKESIVIDCKKVLVMLLRSGFGECWMLVSPSSSPYIPLGPRRRHIRLKVSPEIDVGVTMVSHFYHKRPPIRRGSLRQDVRSGNAPCRIVGL